MMYWARRYHAALHTRRNTSIPYRIHKRYTIPRVSPLELVGVNKGYILPQILGSLPEVIRSCCHHHHQRSSRGRLEWSARFHRPSRRAAGPGKRHSARGTPRAQPRDVRSAGRDTWNLTGEALGGPRKRSWRRCSRARSGRRSAIRGAHSGALDRPEPSDPAARAPIRTSAPYSAADASGSSCAAGARLR